MNLTPTGSKLEAQIASLRAERARLLAELKYRTFGICDMPDVSVADKALESMIDYARKQENEAIR